MKKVMLVGECGSGKTALVRILSGGDHVPRRALAVEHIGRFIVPPGEFLENRRFYPALITASVDAALILFLQNASARSSLFPPQFAFAFNKPVLGLIMGTDLEVAEPERAVRFLTNAGVREYYSVSLLDQRGIPELQSRLDALDD